MEVIGPDLKRTADAWNDAGLPGRPEVAISLKPPHDGYTRVYLSSASASALVSSTWHRSGTLPVGTHPLDQAEVMLHRMRPEYIVIRPDGSIERRTMSP